MATKKINALLLCYSDEDDDSNHPSDMEVHKLEASGADASDKIMEAILRECRVDDGTYDRVAEWLNDAKTADILAFEGGRGCYMLVIGASDSQQACFVETRQVLVHELREAVDTEEEEDEEEEEENEEEEATTKRPLRRRRVRR